MELLASKVIGVPVTAEEIESEMMARGGRLAGVEVGVVVAVEVEMLKLKFINPGVSVTSCQLLAV
jgi:hypothetical protein